MVSPNGLNRRQLSSTCAIEPFPTGSKDRYWLHGLAIVMLGLQKLSSVLSAAPDSPTSATVTVVSLLASPRAGRPFICSRQPHSESAQLSPFSFPTWTGANRLRSPVSPRSTHTERSDFDVLTQEWICRAAYR